MPERRSPSPGIWWPRHPELFTNRDHDTGLELAVAGNDGAATGSPAPLGVSGALIDREGAVRTQVALERPTRQEASGSSSASRSDPASSPGSGLSISRNASTTFLRASGRVRP